MTRMRSCLTSGLLTFTTLATPIIAEAQQRPDGGGGGVFGGALRGALIGGMIGAVVGGIAYAMKKKDKK